MDKSNGGTRPIHAEDILRCTICKVFLEVTYPEVTHVAGVDQLSYRSEASIEASIHSIKSLCNKNQNNND